MTTSQADDKKRSVPQVSPPISLSTKWQTIAKQLQANDDLELKSALQDVQATAATTELDTTITNAIIPLCMDQLDHHVFEIRALALNIIASQLRSENWALEHLVPDLATKLAQQNLLDMKSGESSRDTYMSYQKDLMYTIGDVHNRYPSKLVHVFKPVVNYLVEATDSTNREIATLACKFWGNLKEPPVSEKYMEDWEAPFFPKLNKLVLALTKCMVYHPDYLQYMDSLTVSGSKRPQTHSEEMQYLSDLRNYAALGFEKLCRIFTKAVTPIFTLCVQKWLHSDDWLEQEAIVLALGAYCQAMEGSHSLKEILPNIMVQLLEFYKSEHPMLRSITCFTMVNFINVPIPGVTDLFGRMLEGTIGLINDDNREVQDQALSSMASLLAYSQGDFKPFTKRIVEALHKVNKTTYGKTRYTFYECIGHAASHLIEDFEDNEFDSLVAPLLDNWTSLSWGEEVQGTEEEILSLCSPFSAIAKFTKEKFANHNETLVDKVGGFLSRTLKSKPNDPKGDLMTTHLVAYLDLLSALYEGQGSGLNEVINKNNILALMFALLQHSEEFREEATQSGVALVGHICKHNYSEVTPELDDLLDILFTYIDSKSDSIRGNALWTLAQICRNCHEKQEKLTAYHTELINLFLDLKAEEGVIINSATAFMYLVKQRQKQLLKVLFKAEVFSHLCILLQTPFSQDEQKNIIFHVLCELVAPNRQKVPKDGWIHFMAAAAVLETDDEKLKGAVKGILQSVRGTVGSALWSKINANLDQNLTQKMKKKYKLH